MQIGFLANAPHAIILTNVFVLPKQQPPTDLAWRPVTKIIFNAVKQDNILVST